MVRVSYGKSGDHTFTKIGYRGTNNDILNIPTSGQEFSQFFMGDFEVKENNGEAKISKAVIAEVLSLDTNPLPIGLTKKFSWQMKADYSERNNLCNDCETAGVEGKIGKTERLNDKILLYFLTGLRLHTPEKYRDTFLTEITDIGTILRTSKNSVVGLSTKISYNTQDGYADELYKAEFSQNLTRNTDYRISAETDGDSSAVFFSIGLYFD